eukprot:8661083-Karenia_brevis.AAC.1
MVWATGKLRPERRKTCLLGDNPNLSYTYSGRTSQVSIWTSPVLEIKSHVEALLESQGIGR